MKLSQLLTLTPDHIHPRAIEKGRLLFWGCVAAGAWTWAYVSFCINW